MRIRDRENYERIREGKGKRIKERRKCKRKRGEVQENQREKMIIIKTETKFTSNGKITWTISLITRILPNKTTFEHNCTGSICLG